MVGVQGRIAVFCVLMVSLMDGLPARGQPQAVSWRSVRWHDHVGELSIDLLPGETADGLPSVESRRGGIQRIDIDFDQPVNGAVPAGVSVVGVTHDQGEAQPAVPFAPSAVILTNGGLTLSLEFSEGALPDETCYMIDISDAVPYAVGDMTCVVRSLLGDINEDGEVNFIDVASSKASAGTTAHAGNARYDLNTDGDVNYIDVSLCKARLGSVVKCGDTRCLYVLVCLEPEIESTELIGVGLTVGDVGWKFSCPDDTCPLFLETRIDDVSDGICATWLLLDCVPITDEPEIPGTVQPCPCVPVLGGCCDADGSCTLETSDDCELAGGIYHGDGTTCEGVQNSCRHPEHGACCNPLTGVCDEVSGFECDSRGWPYEYQGDTTTCDPNPCVIPPIGACCDGLGNCQELIEFDCLAEGGTYQGDGTTCGADPCPDPATGACCDPSGGGCNEVTQQDCIDSGGLYFGDGTPCASVRCPEEPMGACCDTIGACSETTQSDCENLDGTYQGDGTICQPETCGIPRGACCDQHGQCVFSTELGCLAGIGGDYLGDGVACEPNPCPAPPMGACCDDEGNCTIKDELTCRLDDSQWLGGETTCDDSSCCFVDLDVDSDNTNNTAPYGPAPDETEDGIEDDASKPGKYVPVNDDDDDGDGVKDWGDGFNRDGTAGGAHAADDANAAENNFVLMKLKVPDNIDTDNAKIRFTYEASDPLPASGGFPAAGRLRVWTKNGSETRDGKPIDAMPTAGDYVKPGVEYEITRLFTGEARTVDLYIEGIRPSPSLGADRILVELDPDGPGPLTFNCKDAVRVTVIGIDLDIDSNNDDGTSVPSRDETEDRDEDRSGEATLPGKLVPVNDDDNDNDQVDDLVDGYDLDGSSVGAKANDNVNASEEDFIPIVLEVPAPIDLTKARIEVDYSASDPAAATVVPQAAPKPPVVTPAPGQLRIWTKSGTTARDRRSVRAATPGDFVGKGIGADSYKPSELGLSGGTRTVTLYVEAIRPSASVADDRIAVRVDPDGPAGPAGPIHSDAVRVTNVRVEFSEDTANQNWGFDEYVNADRQQPVPANDFVSVRRGTAGNTNTCMVTISPFVQDGIHFESADPAVITVSPAKAASGNQTLTVTGEDFAEKHKASVIRSRLGNASGPIAEIVGGEAYLLNAVAKVHFYRVKDSTVGGTTPDQNPTFAALKTAMNGIYKYGVVTVTDVEGDRDKDIRYDLNDNGWLDYYNDGANPELKAIQDEGLAGTNRIAYVRRIRDNWRLSADAAAGQNKVMLVDASAISTGRYTISSPAGGSIEGIRITRINGNELTLAANLAHAHPSASHTVYGSLAGLSSDPQLVTNAGNELVQTVVHEMLHRPAFGNLADVAEDDNTMYWTTGLKGGGLLRFRDQTVVTTGGGRPTGAKDKQWDKLKR